MHWWWRSEDEAKAACLQAQSLRQDPLIPFTFLRVRTAKSLQEGFAMVAAHEKQLQLPIFVAQSPQDEVPLPNFYHIS